MIKNIDLNKKLFISAIITLFIPATYFTATTTDINLYVITVLIKTITVIFSFSILLSLFIKKIFKINFLSTLSSTLFFISIFFSYSYILKLFTYFFGNFSLVYDAEISLLITISLGVIFFLLLIKKNKLLINFLFIFLPLIFFINLFNTINLINTKENFKYPIFSTESYFTNEQHKKILTQNNNRNIYYIVLDGAVTLDEFNDEIKKIDKQKIIEEFKKLKLNYVSGVKSSYINDFLYLDSLAISEIFNLRQFKNINDFDISNFDKLLFTQPELFKWQSIANHISPAAVFPNILTNYKSTPLGITLEKMNYNFYWGGSINSNCIYFDKSICLQDKLGIKNNFKYLTQFESIYKSNYVLRNYLHLTPFIKISNKINESKFFNKNEKKKLILQIDSIKRYLDYEKIKLHNSFTFLYLGMPRIHLTNKELPVSFNPDCNLRKIYHKFDFNYSFNSHKITNRLHYLNKEQFNDYYSSNYKCMMKRIKDFMKHINTFDPTGLVVFQSGHDFPVNGNQSKKESFNLLTYAKVPKVCQVYLNEEFNNINAVRLLLSCATAQKVNFIKNNKI
jgi:hypothetical protein